MQKTIIIMDAPERANTIEEIGEENPFFLGAFGEVIGALKQSFPQGDFSDPTNIIIKTEQGNMIAEIAKHTPVQSFMLHVSSIEALDVVQAFCKKNGWRALDTDTGAFIEHKSKEVRSKSSTTKAWLKFWNR